MENLAACTVDQDNGAADLEPSRDAFESEPNNLPLDLQDDGGTTAKLKHPLNEEVSALPAFPSPSPVPAEEKSAKMPPEEVSAPPASPSPSLAPSEEKSAEVSAPLASPSPSPAPAEEKSAKMQRRRSSVLERVQRIEEGVFSFGDEEVDQRRQAVYQQGVELLARLTERCTDLVGRVAGRNFDDATEIVEGLKVLSNQWERREADLNSLKEETKLAAAEFKKAALEIGDEVGLTREVAERKVARAEERASEAVQQARASEAAAHAAAEQIAAEKAAAMQAELAEEKRNLQAEKEQMSREMDKIRRESTDSLAKHKAALEAKLVEKAKAAQKDAEKKMAAAYEMAAKQVLDAKESAAKQVQEKEAQVQQKEAEIYQQVKEAQRRERKTSVLMEKKVSEAEKQMEEASRIQVLHNQSELSRMNTELTRALKEVKRMDAALTAKTAECESLKQAMSDMSMLSGQSSGGQVGITLTGEPVLGNTLRILGGGPLAQSAMAQWHRVTDSGVLEIIAGATRVQYAPEPRDMGYQLSCMLTPPAGGKPLVAVSSKKISMSSGLHEYVNTLMANGGGEFNVVIVQLNGAMQDRRSVFQLEVLPSKLKIKKGAKTKYKENYNDTMQVCGARGGGDAAAQGLFLALSSSLVFMLACESSRERNAAIMLIRKFGTALGVTLGGPEDSESIYSDDVSETPSSDDSSNSHNQPSSSTPLGAHADTSAS